MIIIHDYFLLLFFCSLCGLICISPSLLNFILLGELAWISLFSYSVTGAIAFDSLLFFIWGVFLLCLAACESTIGLSLILFKALTYGTRNLITEPAGSNNNYLNFLS